MESILSERANILGDWKDDTLDENFYFRNTDVILETLNLSGYINLGTSINNLHRDIAELKLDDIWICDFYFLGYKDYEGSTIKLRQAMASFITNFFESYEPVSLETVHCSTGITSCLDMLCHCLANPGDVFLVPTPMSGCTYKNCMQRSLVELYPVHIITDDDEDEYPCLTIDKIICAYDMAVKADNSIRGIFLTNPNNPLGDAYSATLLMEIMSFCNKKSLHLIVNETFALSVCSMSKTFHSILKFPHIPDSDRTHVIYGLSKEFGIPELSIGVIHTKCEQIQKCLKNLSCLHTIPHPMMKIAAELLEDLEWCRMYINKYQKYLEKNRKCCVSCLEKLGIKVRKCEAGIFLWIDLRHFCKSSFVEERKLFNYLLTNAKLHLCPGEELFCVQPGWFRLTIAENNRYLLEGLNRLIKALTYYKT